MELLFNKNNSVIVISDKPTERELRKLYIDNDLTQEQIAERYGVKRRTVYEWFSEYGISRDDKIQERDFDAVIKLQAERAEQPPVYEIEWKTKRTPPEIEDLICKLYDSWIRRTTDIARTVYDKTRNKIDTNTVKAVLRRMGKDVDEGLWNQRIHNHPYEAWLENRMSEEAENNQ